MTLTSEFVLTIEVRGEMLLGDIPVHRIVSDSVHDHSGEVFHLDEIIVHELRVCDDLLNFLLIHVLSHIHHCIGELLH